MKPFIQFVMLLFITIVTQPPVMGQSQTKTSQRVEPRENFRIGAPRFTQPLEDVGIAVGDKLSVVLNRFGDNRQNLGFVATVKSYERDTEGVISSLTYEVTGIDEISLLKWLPPDAISFELQANRSLPLGYDPAHILRYVLAQHNGSPAGSLEMLEESIPVSKEMLDRVIDESKFNVHPNFIHNPSPLETAEWKEQQVAQKFPNRTVFQVFLERPEQEEKITMTGTGTIKMLLYLRAGGAYHETVHGGFSGTSMNGIDPGELTIAAPYHLPAKVMVEKTKEVGHVLGEFMLRRPAADQTASIDVQLIAADGNPIADWTFGYGPVTWGGRWGYKQKLSQAGKAKIEGLAAQSFSIGFHERPSHLDRVDIELKPGQITTVRFQLDAEGELNKPDISYEPRQQ